ncbi:MAG: hypothetical protein WBI07_14945, partial [Mobilitalea sp.]
MRRIRIIAIAMAVVIASNKLSLETFYKTVNVEASEGSQVSISSMDEIKSEPIVSLIPVDNILDATPIPVEVTVIPEPEEVDFIPTIIPTVSPTVSPTICPTICPSISPSVSPSISPTVSPTIKPTPTPTPTPTPFIPKTLISISEYDYIENSVSAFSSKKLTLKVLQSTARKYGTLYGTG